MHTPLPSCPSGPPRLRALCRTSRSGSALVMSLVAVMVVALLASTFLQQASAITSRRKAASDRKLAFYMAEAGLAEAYAGLTIGKTGNVGTADEPAVFGDGFFFVEASELQEGVVRLEATGRVRTGRTVLSLVAEKGERSVATLGVFASQPLEIPAGSLIDGWDSRKATYERHVTDGQNEAGRIGSNADLSATGTVERPTSILGDVAPGPGKTLATDGEVEVAGHIQPAPLAQTLPPVADPGTALDPAVVHESMDPLIIPAGQWGLEGLQVGPGADVILQGPATIVVGELSVLPSGGLSFDTTDGTISLTVTEQLTFSKGSVVTTSSLQPGEVGIQVADGVTDPIVLGASSRFYGIVYAPTAEVVVTSDFELFGALAGQTMRFVGPVKLHFDQGLEDMVRQLALPSYLSWRILDLGNVSSGLATDPFVVDGIDPATCPPPADAHADQILIVSYVDVDGTTLSFGDWESAFDWTRVASVDSLSRDGEDIVFEGGVLEPIPADTDLATTLSLAKPITSDGTKDALLTASPLDAATLELAIEDPILESEDLMTVLLQNSPISLDAHNLLLYRDPPMTSNDLRAVLVASAPVDVAIVDEYEARGLLDAADLVTVQDASGIVK